MDKHSILIFGAGINQLELIREAKKMQITTVVIDPSSNPPGKDESDFFYQVDGKDYNTTKEIAIKHRVKGIVTGQMQNPLSLMAKLANELDFLFNSPDVVEKSQDKWLMKQSFQKNNVPCAKAILLAYDEDFFDCNLTNFIFPLIIKPKDAFSSRGVYKVNNSDELQEYLSESRSFASNGDVLIEEFLEGKEYSVESITYRGITEVLQITEKFITPFPNTVEMGHLQPAALTLKQTERITAVVKSAINAIGINNSASHAEVIYTSEGPKMVEIGARLGGDFISSYLTKASTGVNMDKAAVQICLGIKPLIKKTQNKFSYARYFSLKLGSVVERIDDYSFITELDDVVFAHIFIKAGDVIEKVKHSGNRSGVVIVQADSRDEVIEKANLYTNILIDTIKIK